VGVREQGDIKFTFILGGRRTWVRDVRKKGKKTM